MSDFTGNFWHLFVAGITVVGMIACLILLWFSGKTKAMTANDNTTGHVWDGDLREMNNPLPRWWMYMFWITIIFAISYLAMYPGFGNEPGQAELDLQGPTGSRKRQGQGRARQDFCQVPTHEGGRPGQRSSSSCHW